MKKELILMSITCCLFYFFIYAKDLSAQTSFTKRTVATGFNSAWEVLYGPNDSLWVTESKAYTISRVSVGTGLKTQLIDIRATDGSINFTSGSGIQPQGGLMGLALHPNLFSTDESVRNAAPWVYAAYVYNRGACPGTNTTCIFTTKIVRFQYDGNTLFNPVTILNDIPGSTDHNSGRLVMGNVIESGADANHTQYRLYYTVGDMGAGQFLNTTRPQNAQEINIMEGKVLRINTLIDTDGGADDWVPNDNPFYNSTSITPQDYVFSFGHRNPQGLAWGYVNGTNFLYSSEQMDRTDDEINIIEAGKNYGWDKVSGYCDGNVDGYRIGQNNSVDENAFCSVNIGVHKEPIYTLFTANAAAMPALMGQNNNALWPTVACSSIEFYNYNVIPGWPASLLVTPLKKDFIYRLKLNATGNGIAGDTVSYFRGDGNRIRKITASPNGFKLYIARDIGATINGGSIMEYTYTGPLLAFENGGEKPQVMKNLVRIYPNPVSNILYVQAKKEMRKPLLAQLFDIKGKLVIESTSYKNTFSIDISSLAKGIYIFKLYNAFDEEMQIEKISKF